MKNAFKIFLLIAVVALAVTFAFIFFAGSVMGSKYEPETATKPAAYPIEKKIVKGEYYFDFDEVIHYKIDTNWEEIIPIAKKKGKTVQESLKVDVILNNYPTSIADSAFVRKLKSLGFKSVEIDAAKLNEMREIFREKSTENNSVTTCLWIYRDIYIFKKKGKITGIAKICHDCGHEHFLGTEANTESFGKNGENAQLLEIEN